MDLHFQIELSFTEKALALRAGLDNTNFMYNNMIPFPGVGDLVSFPEDGGEQVFVVALRKFTFTPSLVTLQVLLDIPG